MIFFCFSVLKVRGLFHFISWRQARG